MSAAKSQSMTGFQKLVGISVLIISLTLVYFFLVYSPQNKETQLLKQAQKINEQEQKGDKLEACLKTAKNEQSITYELLLDWAKENNQDKKTDLSGAFNSIKEEYERDRNDCYKKY